MAMKNARKISKAAVSGSTRAAEKYAVRRIPSGIPGFDALVGGGLVEKSMVVLRGDTGTGKTVFALQFMHSGIAKFSEPGIYISFNEDKEALYTQAMVFGWDLEKLEAEGKFAFVRYEPHEVARVVEEGGGTIRDLIDSTGAKRLVMDSITPYTLVFSNPYKENEAILDLFRILRSWQCTSLLISEGMASLAAAGHMERVAVLADAVINFHYVREQASRARSLEILKMKDSGHSEKQVPCRLGPRGFEVL